jgi:predicted cupin superfamily sugar epimerase
MVENSIALIQKYVLDSDSEAFWIRKDSSNRKLWYIVKRSYLNPQSEWDFYTYLTKDEAKHLHKNKIVRVWHTFVDEDGKPIW